MGLKISQWTWVQPKIKPGAPVRKPSPVMVAWSVQQLIGGTCHLTDFLRALALASAVLGGPFICGPGGGRHSAWWMQPLFPPEEKG